MANTDPFKTYPVFEDPTRGPLQDFFDIGRITIGMENVPGRYATEKLGKENVEDILLGVEALGLGSLGLQAGKGVRNISRKFTPKGRKKAKEAKEKAKKKQAVKLLKRHLGKFATKRAGLATLGAGVSAVFPPAAAIAGPVIGGLSIMDLLADKEMRYLIPKLPGIIWDYVTKEEENIEESQKKQGGLISLINN